jgi:hypothetical protein
MRLLLKLYPRWWRCRYQEEMLALLEETRLTPGEVLDLLRGALDARLAPLGGRRLRLAGAALGLTLLAGAGAAASAWYELHPVVWIAALGRHGLPPAVWLLLEPAAAVAVGGTLAWCGRMLRLPLASWFCLLLGLRQAIELPLGYLLSTHPMAARGPWVVGVVLGECALWAGITAIVLRRAGVSPLRGLAAGFALQIVLGALTGFWLGWGLPSLSGAAGRALAATVWAALLAWLIARARRPPDWGAHPGAGAGVPAKPLPDAPPALTTRVG